MFSKDEARREMTRSLLYGPLGFLVTACLVLGYIGMCDRPAAPEAAPSAGALPSACGSVDANASARARPGWTRWSCRSASETDAWSSCLERRAYTDAAGRGCPGAERCCPP